jgi:hypothetical protein
MVGFGVTDIESHVLKYNIRNNTVASLVILLARYNVCEDLAKGMRVVQ